MKGVYFNVEKSFEGRIDFLKFISMCVCVLRKEKWNEEFLQLLLGKQNFNKKSYLALIRKC